MKRTILASIFTVVFSLSYGQYHNNTSQVIYDNTGAIIGEIVTTTSPTGKMVSTIYDNSGNVVSTIEGQHQNGYQHASGNSNKGYSTVLPTGTQAQLFDQLSTLARLKASGNYYSAHEKSQRAEYKYLSIKHADKVTKKYVKWRMRGTNESKANYKKLVMILKIMEKDGRSKEQMNDIKNYMFKYYPMSVD